MAKQKNSTQRIVLELLLTVSVTATVVTVFAGLSLTIILKNASGGEFTQEMMDTFLATVGLTLIPLSVVLGVNWLLDLSDPFPVPNNS